MRVIPRAVSKLFKRPSPGTMNKLSTREKLSKTMRGGMKYVAMGGALSLGAEGISALVNHAKDSPTNMLDSEKVEFQDWGPSIFRVDSVDTAPKSKLPFSLITTLLITLAIFFCIMVPFCRIISVMIRTCRLNRALKISSPVCPPPFGPPSPREITSPPVDLDGPPEDMESAWRNMTGEKPQVEEAHEEATDNKLQIEEEIKARERADIGDVVEKIRRSVAVKAAERYRQEQEQNNED